MRCDRHQALHQPWTGTCTFADVTTAQHAVLDPDRDPDTDPDPDPNPESDPRMPLNAAPARPPGHTRVKSAKFVKSSTALEQCPPASLPELAVIGRSNVGKSSLVNALTNQASLAKVSKTPGATPFGGRLIRGQHDAG